jgi:hypothetical protein
MTDQIESNAHVQKLRQGPTKAFSVEKLLSRAKGASLAEIMETTGWQPHSARAFMTGLRKKGRELVRECRPSGETCWRIER